MKIRNGFVSNSSSSSFIVGTDYSYTGMKWGEKISSRRVFDYYVSEDISSRMMHMFMNRSKTTYSEVLCKTLYSDINSLYVDDEAFSYNSEKSAITIPKSLKPKIDKILSAFDNELNAGDVDSPSEGCRWRSLIYDECIDDIAELLSDYIRTSFNGLIYRVVFTGEDVEHPPVGGVEYDDFIKSSFDSLKAPFKFYTYNG